jgi:hypothetical protein
MKASIIQPIALLLFCVAMSTACKAQTENTGERLITQLKNGTTPGLLFTSEKPAPAAANDKKENGKESLITQIKKGTAPGMQFKPVTRTSTPVTARAATAALPKQPLPSEQAATKPEQANAATVAEPKQE